MKENLFFFVYKQFIKSRKSAHFRTAAFKGSLLIDAWMNLVGLRVQLSIHYIVSMFKSVYQVSINNTEKRLTIISLLMSGGHKRPYVLQKICDLWLQGFLSSNDHLLPPSIKELIAQCYWYSTFQSHFLIIYASFKHRRYNLYDSLSHSSHRISRRTSTNKN